ncbi:MAG TPA: hypothetical protein VMS01_11265 [Stellaceae bacterium]|nr:hypothetical protein [Stellaceae bacterium]
MMSRWKSSLFAGAAVVALVGAAAAQSPPQSAAGQAAPSATTPSPAAPLPPPPPPAAAADTAPLYNPDQLPAQRGQVQQFTLTPRGDIDGLILADGTEVKTPPHLSTQIAYSVKPGDTVVIHGLHAAALPLIQAASITDEATARTVVDNGPPEPGRGPGGPPPRPPPAPDAGPGAALPGLTQVPGRVRMALHGPRGDVNGALLDDGTVLRLPPPEAYRFTDLLQPGQALVAEGSELVSAVGKVVEVRQLGPSQTQLSLVAAPTGPGRRRPPPLDPYAPARPPRP